MRPINEVPPRSPHHHTLPTQARSAPENTILLCFQLNISSEHKYRRAIYKWALCAPLNAILRWTSIETARGIYVRAKQKCRVWWSDVRVVRAANGRTMKCNPDSVALSFYNIEMRYLLGV